MKKRFVEAYTSRSQEKANEEMDPSMVTTFLETCMMLMRDSKPVKGLHELINRCFGKENTTNGPHVVREIGRHKTRTGREMRITAQIGEYEMDKFILDFGSKANVVKKKTWELMGKMKLQWSPIQLRMENQ